MRPCGHRAPSISAPVLAQWAGWTQRGGEEMAERQPPRPLPLCPSSELWGHSVVPSSWQSTAESARPPQGGQGLRPHMASVLLDRQPRQLTSPSLQNTVPFMWCFQSRWGAGDHLLKQRKANFHLSASHLQKGEQKSRTTAKTWGRPFSVKVREAGSCSLHWTDSFGG